MTVATILVLYAACVGTLGSRMLGRATWPGRAPLLAIVTYLAAAWSVAAALGLAGLTLAIHATALAGGLSTLIGACALRLRDAYAATVAGLGLTVTGAVVARTAIVATTHLRAIRRHALHHRLLAIARIGSEVLPFVALTRDMATQVARLIEMHADDVATGTRDGEALATALVALGSTARPAAGLAAAATDAVQRIRRLLGPAEPLGRAHRQLLRAGAGALALTPVLFALTPAVVALALGRVPAS